jgi:hypothetical protein
MVTRNKRYIVWFYLLNLALAFFGTAAFSNQAHEILDHSLLSDRLVHGFDMGVFAEMLARPEFGSTRALSAPAGDFAFLFFIATALFLPGVLQGYASTYRLPREDFFRACGRNLWRFIRLLVLAGIVMGIVAGALFAIRAPLLKAAGESTNELLPFYLSLATLLVIFLVMSVLRIWFDLAQADVVLSDQRAVRKSIAAAFRHTWRGLGRLLASYVVATIVAAIVLVDVDEVCSARECAGRVLCQPVDAALPPDSALLAARRSSKLLPAKYGAADRGRRNIHYSSRCHTSSDRVGCRASDSKCSSGNASVIASYRRAPAHRRQKCFKLFAPPTPALRDKPDQLPRWYRPMLPHPSSR